jgi:hypothetical protein
MEPSELPSQPSIISHEDLNKIKKRHKSKIVSLSIFVLVLLLSLISLCFILYSFIATKNFDQYKPSIFLPGNSKSPTSDIFANLSDQKCKDEKFYSNQLIMKEDLDIYDKSEFYFDSLQPKDKKGKISKEETLYIEFISWDKASEDSLNYTGKALVCIKSQNKIGTVSFSTNTANFLNPVRYRDPENSVKHVLIQAIYLVPTDAIQKSNWQEKIEANLKNLKNAQNRIFDGKSQVDYKILPEPVITTTLQRDLLTQIAKGIVDKSNEDDKKSSYYKAVNVVEDAVYMKAMKEKYPEFFSDIDSELYNQITTLVYFEVGNSNKNLSGSRKYESGYAFLSPVMNSGNYFGIIGVNLSDTIANESAPYHEFMHTLGLRDEYAYTDGTIHRKPQHLFRGQVQNSPTLMEEPDALDLSETYIDDQVRVMMGV